MNKPIYWLLVLLTAIAIFLAIRAKEVIAQDIRPLIVDHPQNPKEFTERLFKKNPQEMLRILKAESGYDCDTVDYKNPGSTAKGCFQILDGTWKYAKCEGSVLDWRDNIRCAKILYDESGTTPWNASKNIWSK